MRRSPPRREGCGQRTRPTWSGDPAVQQEDCQSSRLAESPSLMADHSRTAAGRLRRASAATASPTSFCSAWAARASRRKCCARCSASRPGWPRLHMLDSTDPAAVRAAATPPATTLYPARRASRERPSSPTRWRRISASACTSAGITEVGGSFRRDHRRGHRAGRRARARAVPRRLHQPVRHRRPVLRAVVLRDGAGGADGTGRRGDRRLGARDAGRRASPDPATAIDQSRRRRSAC